MAFINCNFYSKVLGFNTSMNVILPQRDYQTGLNGNFHAEQYKVLFLLHGLSDDHTIWMRRTSIERYVDCCRIAVIMPCVQRSFYTDMYRGYHYWTFISEELPTISRMLFPLSDRREDNFVAGLSMGGYGAFKLAMSCPEKFAAGASLSGALDVANPAHSDFYQPEEYNNIFGNINNVPGSKNDLFYLAKNLASYNGVKPRLYQCCGTEDILYEDNVKFRDYCKKLNLDLTYEEEKGTHTWSYWDQKIQRVLEWLPLIGEGGRLN